MKANKLSSKKSYESKIGNNKVRIHGRTGHSSESRDVLCFLMQHSLLFAISNGRIRNIQSESICNMEWKTIRYNKGETKQSCQDTFYI